MTQSVKSRRSGGRKKALEKFVNPRNKNSNAKDRQGYDKKERSNLERAIDLFNNSSQ